MTDFGVSHTRKPAFGSGFHTRLAYYRPLVTWPATWRRRFVTNAADNESLVTARGADRCGRVTKMLRTTGEAGRFWFGVSHTRSALVRGITHTCSGFHTHFVGVSHTNGRGITHSEFGVSHTLLKIKNIKNNVLAWLSTGKKMLLTYLSYITYKPPTPETQNQAPILRIGARRPLRGLVDPQHQPATACVLVQHLPRSTLSSAALRRNKVTQQPRNASAAGPLGLSGPAGANPAPTDLAASGHPCGTLRPG